LYDSWIRNTFAAKFASFIPTIGEMLWQVGIFTGYSINKPDGYMIQLKYCDVFSQRNFEALTKYFLIYSISPMVGIKLANLAAKVFLIQLSYNYGHDGPNDLITGNDFRT
jgi:glycerol uptake facilitator-like aquaporin